MLISARQKERLCPWAWVNGAEGHRLATIGLASAIPQPRLESLGNIIGGSGPRCKGVSWINWLTMQF